MKNPERLGALESKVMDQLWDHGPANIRKLIDDLPSDPAYTTIATVLSNLEKKGFVFSSRQGRSVFYRATVSREQHVAAMMSRALESGSDRTASIHQFVDSMSKRDRTLLREYLLRQTGEDI